MAASLTAIASISGSAEARDTSSRQIDISASTLPEAISELARETSVSIGTEGTIPQLRTPAVHGRLSIGEALARLLAGTGYVARQVGGTAWRIERSPVPSSGVAMTAPTFEDPVAIVVTASKRDQALAELPMALSVVNLDDSRRHDPASDTALIASEVEGLALTSMGPGRNRMFLRGVADSPFNGESQSTVAVLLDDARLTYSAPDPDIRLVDVERIEVLKGPQGSLYGTGALGGIYHIVTHRADLDETTLTAALGTEAVALGGTGYSVSAVANLPLVPGRAGIRLVGYNSREAGWVDTGSRKDTNEGRLLGTRAGLGVDAGGGWRIDLTGFAQWLESRDSQYVYKPGAHARPEQLPEPNDNDLRHISARLAKRTGGLDFVLSSAMTWHEVGDTLDASVGAADFGLADPELLEDDRQYRVWDNEARLSGKAGTMNWLVGLSYIGARQEGIKTLVAASSSATMTIDDDRSTTTDSAAFGDITLPLLDKVKLSLGARIFHSVVKETRALPLETVTREQRRTGVTPSASLSWQPRAGRLFFLRYGSAFRQGGVDISATGQFETLKSDELTSIEAGWREQTPGGGQLDVGAHLAWWENMQSDMLLANGLVETENAGNARIAGVEISLDQPLAPGWHLSAGAALENALLVKNALGIELDDRRLPVVPEYTLRGALQHDFQLGKAAAWASLQLRYLGPAHLSFDPALDQPMGNVLESRLEGHAALNGFELTLAIENLLNRASNTFAFGNPLRFAIMHQYTPQRPLAVSMSVLKHF